MARVNSASQVADTRGKIGGTVVSSNAQGAYMKSFVPPTLCRTPAQQAQRAQFARYCEVWQGLTPELHALWNATAALPGYERLDWWGNPYSMSGQNLFLATATLLIRVGVPVPLVPPLSGIPPPPPLATAALQHSESLPVSTIALSPPYGAGVAYVLIDAAYRIPRAATSPGGPLTPFYAFTAPAVGPVNVQDLLEQKWGYLPPGGHVFAQVFSMTANGRCSLPVSYTWRID